MSFVSNISHIIYQATYQTKNIDNFWKHRCAYFRNFEDADDHDCYDAAYRTKTDCEFVYPCPFSLLKLLLYNLYTDIP